MGDVIIRVFMLVTTLGIACISFVVWLNRRHSQSTEHDYETGYNPREIFAGSARRSQSNEVEPVGNE